MITTGINILYITILHIYQQSEEGNGEEESSKTVSE